MIVYDRYSMDTANSLVDTCEKSLILPGQNRLSATYVIFGIYGCVCSNLSSQGHGSTETKQILRTAWVQHFVARL
jgi:hypothetical protein